MSNLHSTTTSNKTTTTTYKHIQQTSIYTNFRLRPPLRPLLRLLRPQPTHPSSYRVHSRTESKCCSCATTMTTTTIARPTNRDNNNRKRIHFSDGRRLGLAAAACCRLQSHGRQPSSEPSPICFDDHDTAADDGTPNARECAQMRGYELNGRVDKSMLPTILVTNSQHQDTAILHDEY